MSSDGQTPLQTSIEPLEPSAARISTVPVPQAECRVDGTLNMMFRGDSSELLHLHFFLTFSQDIRAVECYILCSTDDEPFKIGLWRMVEVYFWPEKVSESDGKGNHGAR